MGEFTRSGEPSGRESTAARQDARPPTTAARALALQRKVGNRAAARVLARWAPHPDKDKKGVFMTDGAADVYNRLNPPLSK